MFSAAFEALPARVVMLEVVVPMIGVGPLIPDAAPPDAKIPLPDTMTFPVAVGLPTGSNDAAVTLKVPVPTSAAVPMDAVLVGELVAAVVFVK